jgi:hypothetical protein
MEIVISCYFLLERVLTFHLVAQRKGYQKVKALRWLDTNITTR